MRPSDDDEIIAVGEPFQDIASVEAKAPFEVRVTWTSGRAEDIDIEPDVLTFKAYARLRADPALFRTVHVVNDGAAIAWGADDSIDMPVSALERLASQAMTGRDLRNFMASTKLTRDALAAQLGISRRLVGYYLEGRKIPRHIFLACAYLRAHVVLGR